VPSKMKKHLLIITLILSVCSIVYELMVANVLAHLSGYHVLWQCLTIGIYIGGLGIGAYQSEKLIDAGKIKYSFIRAELALSYLGLFSIIAIMGIKVITRMMDIENLIIMGYPDYYLSDIHKTYIGVFIFFSQFFTVAIGYYSGFEVPSLIEMFKNKKNDENETNIILGMNYLGALVGTLLFVLWMHPKLDLIYTSMVISLVNILCCVYLIKKYKVELGVKFKALIGIYPILFVVILLNETNIQQTYLKSFFYFKEDVFNAFIKKEKSPSKIDFFKTLGSRTPVIRKKSLYQYIDIFERTYEDDSKGIQMHLDGHFQFDTQSEPYYHEAFAHIPMMALKHIPKKVLILGGGDGLLLREILKYKEIESITHIELDKEMIDFSHNLKSIRKLNKGALFHKRVKQIITDGFYYLRNTKEKYDAIFIDFPYPHNYNLAKLYSVEFYHYALNHLNKNGFIVIDCPIFPKKYNEHEAKISKTLNSILFSTVEAAGAKTRLPLFVQNEGFLVIGKDHLKVDYEFHQGDLSKLDVLKDDPDIRSLKGLDWQYTIEKNLVNSIFKPSIINKVPAVF
jgi:spermidine synthase